MALGSIHAGSGISAYQNAVNLSPQSKASEEAKKLNLRTEETVGKAESRYDLDGKLKEEHLPVAMPKLEKEEGEKDPFSAKGEDTTEKGNRRQDGFSEDLPMCQCETCRKRRYQDDSDDSAVSFQSATRMSPAAAAHRVRQHEMEHVRRESAKADQEGKRVVSQSVQIKTDTCEECGRMYVSGGLTRTVTRPDLRDFHSMFMLGFDGTDLKTAENI